VSEAIRISITPPAHRRMALEWLFPAAADAAQPAAVRAEIERLADAETCDLISADRGGVLCAAIGVELQPGRTAQLIQPRVGTDEATTITLLRAAVEQAWRRGATLVQTLLETDASDDARRLQEAGFRHIADLLYLVSMQESFPESRPAVPVALRAFEEHERPALAELIERTYDGTRDCPQLNGVRTAEDVVAGYQAVGQFSPERWLIASEGGRDIGCLLLADHTAYGQWELVYLGLAPEARGRGLGFALTRHAQWLVREAGREKLVLAVDADNAPALRLYAQAGFSSWDRRSVFVALRRS
jgi:mycothiol synthase